MQNFDGDKALKILKASQNSVIINDEFIFSYDNENTSPTVEQSSIFHREPVRTQCGPELRPRGKNDCFWPFLHFFNFFSFLEKIWKTSRKFRIFEKVKVIIFLPLTGRTELNRMSFESYSS